MLNYKPWNSVLTEEMRASLPSLIRSLASEISDDSSSLGTNAGSTAMQSCLHWCRRSYQLRLRRRPDRTRTFMLTIPNTGLLSEGLMVGALYFPKPNTNAGSSFLGAAAQLFKDTPEPQLRL